jgi:hypothetical protein
MAVLGTKKLLVTTPTAAEKSLKSGVKSQMRGSPGHESCWTAAENLRALGLEYPELDYTKALPFLLMLPCF